MTAKKTAKPAKTEAPPATGAYDFYRTLAESALDGMLVHVDHRVVFANRAAAALLGYTGPAALVGQPLASFVHPADLASAEDRVRRVMAGEAVAYPVEVRYVRRDGTELLVENTGALVSYEGKPAILAVIRDISARKREGELLRRAEHLLRSTIDSSRDIIMAIDRDYRYLCFNTAHRAVMRTAYGVDVAVGLNVLDCITSPADRQNAQANYDRALAGEHHSTVEEYGSVERAYYESFYNPLRNGDGEVFGITAIARDVTDHKRAEEALQYSLSQWNALAEHSPFLISTIDRDGVFRYVNKVLPGLDMQKLLGASSYDFMAPEHQDFVRKSIAEVFATGATARYELKGTGADGRTDTWYETHLSPIVIDGKVVNATQMSIDITERKRAEEARALSEERLAEAQAVTKVGSWETDLATLQVAWSTQVYRIFDIDPDSFQASHPAFLAFVHPDDRAKVDAAFVASFDRRTVNAIEHRIVTPGGLVKVVEERWRISHDEEGRPVRARGTCQDITERKRAEDLLRYNAAIIAEVNDAIIATKNDEGFTITHWNPGAEKIYGWLEKEVLGKSSMFLQNEYPGGEPLEIFEKILQAGLYAGEVIQSRKDETRVVIDAKLIARKDDQGATTDWIWLNRDITDRKRAERVLAQERSLLRAFMNNVPDHVYFKDRDSRFIRINKAQAQLFGMSDPAQAIGKTDFDFFTEEHARQTCEDEQAIMRTGQPVSKEERETWADRPDTWVSTIKVPLCDEAGNVVGTFGISRDITVRQRAEEAGRDREAQLREAQRIAGIGSWEWTPGSDTITWSSGLHLMLGRAIDRGAPAFATLSQYYAPESWARLGAAIAAAIETGAPYELQAEMVREDGTPCWTSTRGEAVRGPDGAIAKLRGTVLDITERKRAEEELARAGQQHALVLNSAAEGILGLDVEGRHMFVNAAAARMFGYEAEELIGRPSHSTWHHTKPSGSPYPREECPIYAALRDGAVHRRSTEVFWRKDGTSFPVDYASTPIRSDGRLTGAVVTFSDITERQEAEKVREALQAQLHLAQKAESLGRMAGAVAHNYNNILGTVLLNLELAQTKLPADAGARKNIDDATKASHRAAEIGRQMLAYLGQARGKREPVDLGDICREALAPLTSTLLANARLTTDFRTQGVTVRADAAQLKRVLTNLAENAAEALGDGGGDITVSIGVVPAAEIHASRFYPADWEPKAGTYACLAVADTGGGMTPEILGKVFDPFFSTKFTGRGLGLPVVMGIVQAHEGACAAESSPGQGTTFRVYLPVVGEQPVAIRAAEPVGSGTAEERGLVLVVEDDATLRNLTRTVLEAIGYSVLDAADGTAAVEVFRQHRDQIRCVLCDVTMPGMDGWATLEALRSIRPDAVVILASGYDEAQVMAGEHAERPQAFLHKPYVTADLKVALAAALKER